jgi:nitrite reductase/ring-hydroxylating ferredoxin subunit
VICPWHGYEYSAEDGTPPPGFDDAVNTFPVEQREDGIYVGVPERSSENSYRVKLGC